MLAAPACGSEPTPEEREAALRAGFTAPASTPGFLRLDGSTLTFAPCSGSATPVDDLPDGSGAALVREFGASDGGLLVLARIADGAITEIRYAAPEGPRCTALPPRGDVEARGNEPFWLASVDGPIARYQTPDDMDGVIYTGGAWQAPAPGTWQFTASRADLGTTERLTVTIATEPCTDSMSGARFPFRATVVVGDLELSGCALEGRSASGP